MQAIQNIIGDFLTSLKSKRVVSGILLVLMMAAYQYFNLAEYGISEEQVNSMCLTIAALIVGDSLRPVNPSKLEDDS